jgi:heat shock protein HtpX
MSTHYDLVTSNKRKSSLIVVFFITFVLFLSYIITYVLDYPVSFMGMALIFSGIMSFGSYYYSDQIILKLSSARVATREEFFDFFTAAENLSMVAQIPTPKLYVIDDTSMNAFATGRDPDHAVVCATTGLISRLNRTELEAVIAHELAHVKNYDIRLMSIVTILVGFIALLADWMLRASLWGGGRKDKDSGQLGTALAVLGLLLVLLSPIIANLIKLAISRRREFYADATAISFTRQPSGLISALTKISQDAEPLEVANKATAHLYFSNPLKNHHDAVGWFSNLFNTHPPISERIAALSK